MDKFRDHNNTRDNRLLLELSHESIIQSVLDIRNPSSSLLFMSQTMPDMHFDRHIKRGLFNGFSYPLSPSKPKITQKNSFSKKNTSKDAISYFSFVINYHPSAFYRSTRDDFFHHRDTSIKFSVLCLIMRQKQQQQRLIITIIKSTFL